ncbi:FkbM family methyltransferase [Anianabacter salinae]|uniref:FkbM family methyltransferase n=1 Tax=Anianabacter salinae TaxID=2851023 RepID=UPI00225DEBBB|nr:FkbM family methyltransferase [Anianabacter salinae]MBV0913480.1 FkbM family methyltransferase [Anianabacter salinae]
MQRTLRASLKPWVPAPLRSVLGAVTNIARRSASWLYVLRNVSGAVAQDRAALRASFAAAPRHILTDLAQWRDPVLAVDATLDVRSMGRFAVRSRSDDLGHVLAVGHLAILSLVEARLAPGDTVVDAGANIGALTVAFARKVGSAGAVVAVEMMPETAACLRRNLALNKVEDRVRVVESALSSVAGETVNARVPEGLFGQASIADAANAGQAVRQITVRTTTLDDVTEVIGDIALLKLDLEGAEPMALRGAVKTLRKTRLIAFESWAGEGDETSAMLIAAGFDITRLDARNFLATRRAP